MSKKSKAHKNIETINIDDIRESDDKKEINMLVFGENMNNIFTNTIIRTALSLVGAYAFSPKNIVIEENTSIFNNDILRLRFSNFAIYNGESNFPTIEDYADRCIALEQERNERMIKPLTELEKLQKETEERQQSINNLHIHIDARNNTKDIMYATTNEQYATFYLNSEQVADIYPEEHMLIHLKPNQSLVASLKSTFDIPLNNYIHASTQKAWHRYITETKHRLFITSYGQISGRRVIIEACHIINKKLELLRSKLFKAINESDTVSTHKGRITIVNDKYTIGEIYNRRMQDHEKIKFHGYKVDHPDNNEFICQYETLGMSIIRIIDESIDSLIDDYTKVINSLKE